MNVSSPGQANGAGDARFLYLRMFAGEVLSAFNETNLVMPRTTCRSITAGRSAQFPATWKAAATYHTPGVVITGGLINSNERTIVIDDLLVSSVFMANIDDAMSHYDVRSEYSKQCAAALARAMDRNLLQVGILAARATTTVLGGFGGGAVIAATALTNADVLVAALFDAARILDDKDVPEGDRCAFLRPAQYYLLVNSSSRLIHADFTGGTNGDIQSGRVLRVAGIDIVKSNNVPVGTTVTTGPLAYQGVFTSTAALVMQKSAIGTVKLVDLAVESDYLVQNQGTLLVAKLAVGHGILRPEASVEIRIAA